MFTYNYQEYKIPDVDDDFKKYAEGYENSGNLPNVAYTLVCKECKILDEFWNKCLTEYGTITLEACLGELEDLVGSVEKYHKWPAKSQIQIDNCIYDHYLFQNGELNFNEKEDVDYGTDYQTTRPEIPTEFDMPEDPDPEEMLKDDISNEQPTPKDFAYWYRYFNLATIICLAPMYWSCGLDIIPEPQLVKLPCIFLCLNSVYIQEIDIVFVFGLSIRGMYIYPIVQMVNLSNSYANIATVLISQMKSIMSKISSQINALAEISINSIADGLIMMIEADSQNLRKENKEL